MELRSYISKALRKQKVPTNKEAYWGLQNWDDIMAFITGGVHLDREVHSTEDLSDAVEE